MRILILTYQTPAYPASGGSSRMHCLLEPLAERHHIRVISTGGAPVVGRPPSGVDLCLIDPGEPVRPQRSSWLLTNARHYLLQRVPWRWLEREHHRRALAASLRAQLVEFRPDVVQVEHGELSALLEEVPAGVAGVLVKPDMLSTLQLQAIPSHHPKDVVREILEASLVIPLERRGLRRATRVVVVTARDARIARRIARQSRVAVVPNCVDVDYWLQSAWGPPSQPPTMLFAAHLGWRPNHAAATELVTKILPQVRETMPDAELVLAGQECPSALLSLLEHTPGARLVSPVADMRPLLRAAWITIAPLRGGSGSPIKILESLASGVPVLTTHRAADAFGLGEWAGVLCARSARQFAATASRMLLDEGLRRHLARAGETVARARFDRSPNAALLEQVWVDAVREA